MKGKFKNIILYFNNNPKKLFLTDSAGAFINAIFLFLIFTWFTNYFGIPKMYFFYLTIIAAVYFAFSITCFGFLKKGFSYFLKAIAIANLLYCSITIALIIKLYSHITVLGFVYFLLETIIICTLVYIEVSVATQLKKME